MRGGQFRCGANYRGKFVLVLLEPLLMFLPGRAIASYQFPEPWRVVHFLEVKKFVDNYIFDDGLRRHNQFPVYAEVFLS